MDILLQLLHTLWSFFVILTIVVFIHEFGHYFVAKLCGVKVEAFSIGFGKELIGRNDRSGTRWKLCLLPLGGYVKMYGDSSAASTADADAMEQMTEAEKKLTFHHKPLYKKALVVAAGPVANFLLTITIFTYFMMTIGLPSADPIIGDVMKDSPAAAAGLQSGDRINKINGDAVSSFSDIQYRISTNVGTPVDLLVDRGGKELTIVLTPKETEEEDMLGNKIKRPLIGIKSMDIKIADVGLPTAIGESVKRTYMICAGTLKVIGQMITGQRSAKDISGPVGIAKLSGQATGKDFHTVLWFIAFLSANLGLANLLPIPLLDGGHLAYYAAEAVRGRPLAQKVQEYGFRLGFVLVALMMAFTIVNDIIKLL